MSISGWALLNVAELPQPRCHNAEKETICCESWDVRNKNEEEIK